MSENNSKRIIILDVARVVAFLMVFAVHILQKYKIPLGGAGGIKGFYWVSIGGLGVTIFIFLSGLVLENKYNNKRVTFKEFMVNRLLRIYPSYWLTILFITIFLGGSVLAGKGWKFLLADFSGLLVFTGLPWAKFIIATGWFVGVIVSLYLLFPLLHWLFKKYNISLVLLGLLFIEVVSRILVGKYMPGHRPLDWFPLCRVFEFGLGMYLVRQGGLLESARKIKVGVFEKPVLFLSSISYQAYLIHTYFVGVTAKTESMSLFVLRVAVLTIMASYSIYLIDDIIRKKTNEIIKY